MSSAAAAPLTLVTPSNDVTLYAPHQFTTDIDLSDLSDNDKFALTASIIQFRQSQKRLTEELLLIATHLQSMKTILGDTRFFRFSEEVLGFNKKKVSRLLKLYRVLDAHFMEAGGKFHPNMINNFSQSGLLMLTEDTDEAVITELKEMASVGTVTQEMVKDLLAKRESEERENVQALTAEITELKRAQAEDRAKVELAQSRERTAVDKSAEALRRLTQERDELENELAQSRDQPPKIETREVEVPPKEYVSKQAALAAMEDKINKAAAELADNIAKAKAADEELRATQERMQVQKAGADEIGRLREQVNMLLLKWPATLITSLSETNPLILEEVKALGKAMIKAGQQLAGE